MEGRQVVHFTYVLIGENRTTQIKVTDDWLTQLEEGNEVAAIFFDIKKAFDSVPRQRLLQKLVDINLDPELHWLQSE